jgi:N-acetylglutamate synthase-like GNAT family acetyltransferase
MPLPDGYAISDDAARLDLDCIHAFISRESYWARGIPRELVAKTISHSLCWGVYDTGGQVGFARVISDRATFAYLCDVYVEPEHRGRGLSKALVAAVLAHPDLQNLRRWMLVTADAQSLYEQFGFRVVTKPECHMEIHRPGIYMDRLGSDDSLNRKT